MRSAVILALGFCIAAQSGAEPTAVPLARNAAVCVKAKYDDVWRHLTDAKSYPAWSPAPGLEEAGPALPGPQER
ncbi:MAG: hypothetical protein OER88_04450 [Planctomycetota bacterium]|nr:hypothetical protein [Planctomycetota bacterium]